jgi:CheY-like chemotaxis protein/signal transduction histidine kinase
MKKETSCRVTDAIIKYVKAERGDLGDLLDDFPYDAKFLTDTNNWVPLAISNALFERLRKMFGDEQITYKVGSASARLEAGGMIGRIAKLLGNPKFIVSQAPRLHATLAATSTLSVQELTDTNATVGIRFKEGIEDIDRDSCDYARGVLASIPDFCGLGLGEVHEPQCYIPIQEKGIIEGHFYRVDEADNVIEYEEGVDETQASGRVVGRLNDDGSFLWKGTLYGAESCVYHMTWPVRERKWQDIFRRSELQEDAIRTRDEAIEELLRVNRRMEMQSEELALANEELKRKSLQLAQVIEKLKDRTDELTLTNEELRKRSEQLALLNRVGQEVTSILNLDELFEVVVASIERNFQCHHVAIFTPDWAFNEVVLQASAGRYAALLPKGYRQNVERGIIGWVARHGKTQLTRGANVAFLHGDAFAETQAELCLPIRIRGETVGVLDLHAVDPEAFTENYIDMMEALSHQIAAAIRNAQLYTEVKEATRFKTEFLTNMSHELRTPLNTIIGFGDLLVSGKSDGPLRPEQQSDVQKILRSAKHLLQLINDILDISRIEAGQVELWRETFDLQEITGELSSTVQALIGESPVEFRLEIEEELPPLFADRLKLKQVILNLLSNAIKFTEKGAITLRAISGLGEVQISVADTGIGLAKEDTAVIFEAFRQVDGSITRQVQGTGLGLAITKSLVEMHGGHVWAESEGPGCGSVFTFTLPLAEGPPPEAALRRELVTATPRPLSQVSPEMQRTILAIDDDPEVIDLLQRSLGEDGYQVVGAQSGEEGLRLARELLPVAITLDVLMPKMDGWETLKNLKSTPETTDIPVIIISIVDNLEHGFSLGAADYVVKPVDCQLLMNKLRSLTGKRVLVVDDEKAVVELVSRALQESGHVVEGAYSGQEALGKLDSFQPEVIILDLIMPDMDGFQVITHLKTDPTAGKIPIIILTAKDLGPEDRQFLQTRVQKVIEKGSLPSQIVLGELKEALEKLTVGGEESAFPPPADYLPSPQPEAEEMLPLERLSSYVTPPKEESQRLGLHNILVVEDEPRNVELIKRVLQKSDETSWQVWVVEDGQEALDFLYRQGEYSDAKSAPRPDVILMDMLTPRLSGYEATKRIKDDPSLRHIPVIAVTAAALTHQVQEALDAGCDDCVTKPYNLEDLLETIKRFLD